MRSRNDQTVFGSRGKARKCWVYVCHAPEDEGIAVIGILQAIFRRVSYCIVVGAINRFVGCGSLLHITSELTLPYSQELLILCRARNSYTL